MEKDFWLRKWVKNDIAFNQEKPSQLLESYFSVLALAKNDTVFVPLCGKSIDMLWLISQGCHVIGVELSPVAVKAFFEENQLSYSIKESDNFTIYFNEKISIYCGDFFTLTSKDLCSVKAVYDRASLVALPEAMREKYVSHMSDIIPSGSQVLLAVIDYDQLEANGPPFSVSQLWIEKHYTPAFIVKQLEICKCNAPERLKKQGVSKVKEAFYFMKNTIS